MRWPDSLTRVAGVDEAGRGPLAGPVVAAAVILPARPCLDGLDDSKKLKPAQRQTLAAAIEARALAWALGRAEVEEIDRLNILQASLLAMRRAVAALAVRPAALLVDGNQDPRCGLPTTTVVGGDGRWAPIAAASILAKVHRDREMARLDQCYPGYGLARHKGYPTAAHLQALARLGASPIHRRSFAPVRRVLEGARP